MPTSYTPEVPICCPDLLHLPILIHTCKTSFVICAQFYLHCHCHCHCHSICTSTYTYTSPFSQPYNSMLNHKIVSSKVPSPKCCKDIIHPSPPCYRNIDPSFIHSVSSVKILLPTIVYTLIIQFQTSHLSEMVSPKYPISSKKSAKALLLFFIPSVNLGSRG